MIANKQKGSARVEIRVASDLFSMAACLHAHPLTLTHVILFFIVLLLLFFSSPPSLLLLLVFVLVRVRIDPLGRAVEKQDES